jgi:lipase maturation factor 1
VKPPGWLWPGPSGPAVATVFQRLLAIVFLIAWISLGSQVRLLIGPRGLMPLESLLDGLAAQDLPWFAFPSLLRWPALAAGGVLVGGTVVGAALAVAALAGLRPRLCFALSTVLYLSYTVAGRDFLAFQWDNLLLECGLLAVFLPARGPAPLAHLLFRLLCFKLYFESGIAKWQSGLHDWHDGSAMTYYYETAPLPAGLAWTAHHLPVWWHHLESRATLVLELVLPFGIFGPRRVRLGVAAALTGFQIVNALTANYGFFCYLAVALHVFLLDDDAVARLADRLPRLDGPLPWPARLRALSRYLAPAGATAWALLSVMNAAVHFGDGGAWMAALLPLRERTEPLRLINTYHLFASITRARIEPQFEVEDAKGWRPLSLWHKPGDPRRRPDYVAPHQPRVDFQLWFHGLSYRHRRPLYVSMLLERLCADPAAVAPLFRDSPGSPRAVRVAYYQYHFTSRAEHRATGAYWNRTRVDTTAPVVCDR